jgi:hypothetical protein
MEFEFRHNFPCQVEDLERVLFHDGLPALFVKNMSTIREIEPLKVERSGKVLKRRVRYLPEPIIKSIGIKKVEPEWMEWHEESTYDFSNHTGSFRNIPARYRIAAVMENTGTLEVRPNRQGGCTEILKGRLIVKVFLVGKLAEKVIHANAVKILEEQAAVVEKILRDKSL